MSAEIAVAGRNRRVLDYARFEAVTFLRNGEQLLVAIVLPALALVGLGVVDIVEIPAAVDPVVARIDVVAPGVLALAIVSSSFTSLAISTAFDRRWGVLRQLATTPLGPRGIVAGKVLAVFAVQVLQLVVLAGLALALGWRPDGLGLLVAVPVWLVGSLCFSGFALALAARLRAEAVLAVANLLWVLFAVGGLVLPVSASFGWLTWLPWSGFGEAMRVALIDGAFAPALAGLAVWAAVSLGLAARLFRPSE